MTPAFKILCSGKDLTALYSERLLSIAITDESTEQADSLSIELSNRDGKIVLPEKGETITVSMGYTGNLREMGKFIIDQVVLNGPPDYVALSGKAAAFTTADGFKPFQTRKTRSWDAIKLGDLVQTIAGEAGMKAAVSAEYNAITLAHVDQTNESDMNLLTRLARDWGAVMKPTFGNLVFVKRGEAKSASGVSIGTVTIKKSDCSSYSAQLGERTKFKKARTSYHDPASGKSKRVSVGFEGDTSVDDEDPDMEDGDGEENTYEHPHDYADEQSAVAGAKSILDQTTRGANEISVTVAGRPDVIAEGTVTLVGFHPKMDRAWCIKTVAHELSKSGYRTTIRGEDATPAAVKEAKTPKPKREVGWVAVKPVE